MSTRGFWQLHGVSDDELVGGLRELLARGARTDARVVAHLAEVEARGLHLRAASSLFEYCQEKLGLSRNEAFYRIVAARLGRRFPVVFQLLEQRKVHLTSLPLIRDYVTAENHRELLQEISGKTKEQILVALATRSPRPDVKSHIRKLPIGPRAVAAGPTGSLEPLSATSYCLQLQTSAQLKEKLELAADLLSHANPSRDLAVVVERALDLLIARLQQKRFGIGSARTTRTSTAQGTPIGEPSVCAGDGDAAEELDKPAESECASEAGDPSQAEAQQNHSTRADFASSQRRGRRAHIPQAIRRQLIERDGLGCTFVCEDGQRCRTRAFLQLHHDEAWARGGSDELCNLRLVCEAHNRWLAEQQLGKERVQAAISRQRGRAA